jgi:hypothetical protein
LVGGAGGGDDRRQIDRAKAFATPSQSVIVGGRVY